MNKILAIICLISFTAVASPKDELSERLSKTNGFSASFSQTVISPDNEVVMEGEGTVEIARPSLFRWTTIMPDENVLVSNGETLWYYSPFVEQVSIFMPDNTVFHDILRASLTLWR